MFLDTDAPKVNGTRYKDPSDDAKLIIYLRNHAKEIIKLVEAAEKMRACKAGWNDMFEALAALEKEQS